MENSIELFLCRNRNTSKVSSVFYSAKPDFAVGIALSAARICGAILHRWRGYVTVPGRMNETLPVLIISRLLMRVVKAHARWRWRA
ncbi:hypothetical protein PspCFBP13528_03365 [Pseudomonas sp. CFBP13528]|nr:hypothetical protein PspCFBP13528_03365 [Pseudomonas sp. CFBP13528]